MEIQEIKRALTLSKVLHHYNLKPDKNLRLHCPFHGDKTPSLQVYYKTHTAYCFSSNCKTHGKSLDVIDFIMYKENCTKAEAIRRAKLMVDGKLSMVNDDENKNENKKVNANPSGLSFPKHEFLATMFTYFKNAVHNSKPSQEYIKNRGLDATKIEVGYNTAQFHHGARREQRLIDNCVAVGLLSPWGTSKTGEQAYKAFAKFCICFALRDRGNHITGLYFRSTLSGEEHKLQAGTPRHFYLKESTGLYPCYPDPKTQKLIITESIIDCASLLQIEPIAKTYSLLSAYGTNRLNDEMKTALKDLPQLEEIIFAFDSDSAGVVATEKYAKELKELLPRVNFSKLELPNKDVNETLIAHNEDIFLHLLENRINIFISTENGEPSLIKGDSTEISIEKENANVNENININTKENTAESADLSLNTSNPNKLIYHTDTATYSILGGVSKQLDMLKVMLQIENSQGFKSRNKVDLYEDKQVGKLCKEVSEKLQIRKDLIAQGVYDLTELLEVYREQVQKKEQEEEGDNKPEQDLLPVFTAKEKAELEEFLKKPKLTNRLNELLGKTGIVGEERSRIFLLLIAISYKMNDPLHALVQGSSGSGKTKIVRQISDCIPQESVTRFTRISDKALYNYPKNYFTNRLLIIEDVDGLSEDAEMAFRELQSNRELRSSVSIKLENGSITGGEKVVKGPIASMSCTTRGEMYEDNMSRVFLIAVDESREQTKRIIDYQNAMAAGRINKREQKKTTSFIQNLIRMLAPREVINPYAEKIKLPQEAHKIRRLNDLFQNFIKMVTLVHQYQRRCVSGDNQTLIAEIEDVEIAIEIMFESIVLKVDELDGSLRQFYEQLKAYLQKSCKGKNKSNNTDNYTKIEFTQREIRQHLNMSKAQVNRYLQSLTELEYLSYNGFANKGFKYSISYWDNYEVLRKRIKDDLEHQISELKSKLKSELKSKGK